VDNSHQTDEAVIILPFRSKHEYEVKMAEQEVSIKFFEIAIILLTSTLISYCIYRIINNNKLGICPDRWEVWDQNSLLDVRRIDQSVDPVEWSQAMDKQSSNRTKYSTLINKNKNKWISNWWIELIYLYFFFEFFHIRNVNEVFQAVHEHESVEKNVQLSKVNLFALRRFRVDEY
jgi:hypothetical protein